MNSFSFEEEDPRFTRLKSGLALRLLSKGLFCIRAMAYDTPISVLGSKISLDMRGIITHGLYTLYPHFEDHFFVVKEGFTS